MPNHYPPPLSNSFPHQFLAPYQHVPNFSITPPTTQFPKPGLPHLPRPADQAQITANLGRLPKLPFPKFNGENPRRWRRRCEKYFHMYLVDEPLWLSVAEMYLEGPADRRYQSVQSQLENASWDTFYRLLHDQFDRNQHEILLRGLFNIRQHSSVQTYVNEFCELKDHLNSYSQISDPLYFTQRFIDGLKPEIRAIVIMQSPKDLDTACSLALLQEEMAVPITPKHARGGDWSSSYKPVATARMPLPLPPRSERPAATATTSATVVAGAVPMAGDAKLTALKTYRRALGLCFKCGTKWSRDHRCPPEVLHAVDPLWESFSSDDSLADTPPTSPQAEHIMLALSKSALSGVPAARTVRLVGFLQQIPVQILVDSGSSSSFVNENLVPQLSGIASDPLASSVEVAGGGRLVSTSLLHQVPWTVDGCTFYSEFRTLPLANFDVVIGMDWLEDHSPMRLCSLIDASNNFWFPMVVSSSYCRALA